MARLRNLYPPTKWVFIPLVLLFALHASADSYNTLRVFVHDATAELASFSDDG